MMKGLYLLAIIGLIGIAFLAGCLTVDPDDQFRQEWQKSEASLNQPVSDIKELLRADNSRINKTVLSADSKKILSGIDKQFSGIAAIRVSSRYSKQKDEYLTALNNLRLACIDFSAVSGAGEIESVSHLISGRPYFDKYLEKSGNVTALMNTP